MPHHIKTDNISHDELKSVIDRVRARIKDHDVVKSMFDEYDVDIDEVDLVPMCFAELDVSARTDHGIIYFNINLLNDGFENDDHYLVHELTHYLQQTTGDKPTKGSDDGNYLDNKEEVEGFQNQTKFLADTRDEDEAETYVEQVLDHHDVHDDKERRRRRRELLQLASIK
jgi:hypothetical protein